MTCHLLRNLVLAALLVAFAVGARVGDENVGGVTQGSVAHGKTEAACNQNSTLDVEHPCGRPYDCHHNLEFWESMWPERKKEWCCLHENIGCKSEHFDCTDGLMYFDTEWSDMKREWCCHNHNVGCAKCDDFLCPEGHEKLRVAVAGSIKCVKWPCKNSECCELWGNMDLERLPTNAPTPLPTFDPTPTPTIAPTPDEDRFHCFSAVPDALLGWSQAKKEWCCFNRNIGCKDLHSEHVVSVEAPPCEDAPGPKEDCHHHHHIVHHGEHSLEQSDSEEDEDEKRKRSNPDLELVYKRRI